MLTLLIKQGRTQVRRHVINFFGFASQCSNLQNILEHDSLRDDPEHLGRRSPDRTLTHSQRLSGPGMVEWL